MKNVLYTLLLLGLLACQPHQEADRMEHAIELAKRFGQAVVDEDFVAAHALLCEEEQRSTTPDSIKATINRITSYTEEPLKSVDVMDEFILDAWPGKKPDELCSVYVSLEGESYSEGVTLTVVQSGQGQCLKVHDWGRP
jgi:hypothetical protein